jgi:hypothetical protein
MSDTEAKTETSVHALTPSVDLSAISIFSRQKTYKMPITTPNMEEDWRAQRNNDLAVWNAQVMAANQQNVPAAPRPSDPPPPCIRDAAGNMAYIEILSAQDAAVQAWHSANPGISDGQTEEEIKAARVKIASELLPIMVKSWYWVNPETKEAIDLPCTPEVISAVFMADEYDHLFLKVMNTMASNRHFFKV